MGGNLGDQLREVRKRRGLTQRELASASGVSVSLVRKLEQGERDDARLETVRRLAVALGVPTTRLIAGRREDSAVAAVIDQWAPVRQALTASVDLVEPATVAGVRETLAAAQPLFTGDRFAELQVVVPRLLRDADALGDEGRALRARINQLAGWLLTQTRQFDVAQVALGQALDDAIDRLDAAATASVLCWLLLRQGRLGEAYETAARWADDVEPRMSRATPTELSTWGWLLLRLSAAAIRDNRVDDADDAMRLAHAASVALGQEVSPDQDFLRRFGPITVTLKRTENAMVTDRPDLVLALAGKIPTRSMRPTSNNRNRHLLDVANAHVRTHRYAEAVNVLSGIRADAPEWLPHQRYARQILGDILDRRRTLTAEMRSLADTVGVPI